MIEPQIKPTPALQGRNDSNVLEQGQQGIGEKFLNIRFVELASLNRPIQTSGFAWTLKLQADQS
ncbi:MAG: hypothetical protein ABI284_02110 [Nitrosospira sp.]